MISLRWHRWLHPSVWGAITLSSSIEISTLTRNRYFHGLCSFSYTSVHLPLFKRGASNIWVVPLWSTTFLQYYLQLTNCLHQPLEERLSDISTEFMSTAKEAFNKLTLSRQTAWKRFIETWRDGESSVKVELLAKERHLSNMRMKRHGQSCHITGPICGDDTAQPSPSNGEL